MTETILSPAAEARPETSKRLTLVWSVEYKDGVLDISGTTARAYRDEVEADSPLQFIATHALNF